MSMINLISFRERTAGGEAMASADARGSEMAENKGSRLAAPAAEINVEVLNAQCGRRVRLN
jgi:hypothetical protein